jgi:hypothetical protein
MFHEFFLLPWLMHVVAMLAGFIGILFLVAYAAKRLSDADLKWWGTGLVVTGVVLCLLSALAPLSHPWGKDHMMRDEMMDTMMDGKYEGMMHGNDHMSMSMTDMSEMLEGKTGDAFDKAFIEGMIPHHQGAIDMAELALQSAGHQEIKDLAKAIVAAQQQEIEQMQQWQQEWGYEN